MIDFSLRRYKLSVSALRNGLGVGVPENRDDGTLEVECGSNHFLFNVEDLYMTHMKLATDAAWSKITRHNYSQMGIADSYKVTGTKIRGAFEGGIPSGSDLAMVILATSEAARSQVVYQVIQQTLQSPLRKLTWGQISPLLIGSWAFNTKENHKTRPIKYGALRRLDYYNTKAMDAIKVIIGCGYNIG